MACLALVCSIMSLFVYGNPMRIGFYYFLRVIITEKDREYMNRALELAAQALGRTSPNPVVGAVVVNNGKIVGEGYHHQAGTPHAEVHALRAAGSLAQGATIYVTLEPCSHHGRTPPCADALVAAGISQAVIATTDPNPLVAGRGLRILEEAGIATTVGVLQDEAIRLNQFFFKYIKTGRPYVTIKSAMTLDGKIACASGDSRWVSGEESRQLVHKMRNIYDAIMVGIGTVLKDDPLLNTRLGNQSSRDPVRVIIDSRLELPLNSQIAKTSSVQKTLLFCSADTEAASKELLQETGIEVIEVAGSGDMLPLSAVLDELSRRELCSVLVEGGAEINASLIEHRLADKLHLFIAPKIAGGRNAPSPVGGSGALLMNEAVPLYSLETTHCGEDILLTGYFNNGW